MADDSSGSEGITVNIAHQVLINVLLPRHFVSGFCGGGAAVLIDMTSF
jgi:hypothetical protein